MDNGFWSTFDCLKGLADDVLSGLSQYLDGNILRDQVAVDQGTKEGILCLGSCRETNLDFFEANFYKKFKKLNLLLQAHWDYKCLVAVTKVYRTPCWCFVNVVLLCPVHAGFRRKVILSFVLACVHHFSVPPYCKFKILLLRIFRECQI